jgi:recombination protein RecR
MHHYPESIRNLIHSFSKLPGVGPKSAERLAIHVLRSRREEAETLASRILAVKDTVRLCAICHSLTDGELCRICSDPSRDASLICVVERPGDMVSIEKSGAFNGRYHILQGVLSPMDGIGPDAIRIRELMERLKSGEIKEVILATGTSVEGEATAAYLAGILREHSVQITRIASGVPMGGDLKYIDQVTLKRAMEGRHAV